MRVCREGERRQRTGHMPRRPVGIRGEGRLGRRLAAAVGERGEEEREEGEGDAEDHDRAVGVNMQGKVGGKEVQSEECGCDSVRGGDKEMFCLG